MIVIVNDKMQSIEHVSYVNCYDYSLWKLPAWWLCIQFGLSYGCNPAMNYYKICNSLQDYTDKTAQTVYIATKLTTSMYYNYNG